MIAMSTELVGAVPPGEHLGEELDSRHWSQGDFAQILGRPAQFVSEIVAGKKEITRESAAQIAAALGTSPEYWLNLQNSYLLEKQNEDPQNRRELDKVRTRSRLNQLAPVSLLQKRGIIRSSSLEGQVREIKELFQIEDLDEEPRFLAAARRANDHEDDLTPVQKAWLACARRKAQESYAKPYEETELEALAPRLPRHLSTAEAFRKLPHLISDAGVRLVYVEAFPSSKISGASFLLDNDIQKPVIALSGRGKRLDIVLFTLMHEIAHLLNGDVTPEHSVIDEEEPQKPNEIAADEKASSWILPTKLPAPPPSVRKAWIDALAEKHGVHPIVVIGRLQRDRKLEYRTALAKGAPTVTDEMERW